MSETESFIDPWGEIESVAFAPIVSSLICKELNWTKLFAGNVACETVTDLLKCVWRSDDKDFPSVEIIILDQACRESLHWVFVQL